MLDRPFGTHYTASSWSIKRWCGFVENAVPAAYALLPKLVGPTAAGAAHEAGARALLQAVGIDCEASSPDRARAQREEVQSILLSAKTCVHEVKKCWFKAHKNGAPYCHHCKGWVLPTRSDDCAPECGPGCDKSGKVCDACNCAVCDVHGLVESDKRWCSSCACALMMCSVDLVASRCSMEALRGTASIGVARQMDLHEMEIGGEGQRQRDAFRAVTGCVEGTCYPVPPMHTDLRRLPYRRKVLSRKEVEPPVVQHESCPMMEADATDIGPNAAEDGVHQWKAEREREAEQEAKAALTCATRVQAARLALSGGRRRSSRLSLPALHRNAAN